jgi:hypothetical protein
VKCSPAVTGEHGLIIGAITAVSGAAAGDIRRQRHVAALRKRLVEDWAVKSKSKRHLAVIAFRLDRGVELFEKTNAAFAAEADEVTRLEALGRAHERTPARIIEPLDQGRIDLGLVLAAAQPPAMQAGGDDFGVVDDQCITCAQQGRQFADGTILECGRRTGTHDQEPRGVPRRRRPQRDAVFREYKIEQGGVHSTFRCNTLEGHIANFRRQAT